MCANKVRPQYRHRPATMMFAQTVEERERATKSSEPPPPKHAVVTLNDAIYISVFQLI